MSTQVRSRWQVFPCPILECGSLVFTDAGPGSVVICPQCREAVVVAGEWEVDGDEVAVELKEGDE